MTANTCSQHVKQRIEYNIYNNAPTLMAKSINGDVLRSYLQCTILYANVSKTSDINVNNEVIQVT